MNRQPIKMQYPYDPTNPAYDGKEHLITPKYYVPIEIGGNKVGCRGVTDDEYENIGRFKKYLEDRDDTDYDIDCSSKFVTFSLFALLALLF